MTQTVPPSRADQIRWFLPLLLLLMLIFWLVMGTLERVDIRPFLMDLLGAPVAGLIPAPLIFLMELFHWRVLRHLLPLLAGWYLSYRATVGLLKTLYDLPDDEQAASLLRRLRAASAAGISPVTLNSATLEEDRPKSVLLRVGGPGQVKIGPHDTAVTELNGRFRRVLGAGTHQLDAFETVHSVIDLRPQDRTVTGITLTTKDGIELTADLSLSFRINRGEEPVTRTNPYPFSPDAVRQAAYAIRVHTHHEDNWDTLAAGQARGHLYQIVASYRLDTILAPDSRAAEPYLTIRKELERRLRTSLATIGLDLIAVQITRLELPEAVVEQFIQYWQSRWHTNLQIDAADSQAQTLQEIDLARIEAEVVMIQAIVEGVRLAREQGTPSTMRDMLALRLIEALEKIARRSQENQPLPQEILPRLSDMRQQIAPPYLSDQSEANPS
jgi:hypothetical protein